MMNQTNKRHLLILLILVVISSGCNRKKDQESGEQNSYPTAGSIERLDEEINRIIPDDAVIEVLAEGFEWSEGPVWIENGNYLLFSDIPPNKVFKWKEGEGISEYLYPSGFSGPSGREGEPGSNGLLLDQQGRLILCQHGDRRLAYMDAPLDAPKPVYHTVADQYDGKRLNSPNDAVVKSNGDIYFTDPPYGLEGNEDDPAKELDFQGVFRWSSNGEVTLLNDMHSRPNGIAFSPDEKTLYVANSDPENAVWMVYDVTDIGLIENARVFYDVTDLVGKEKGLPDGMKVNKEGYLFATGPGGVLVFSPDARHLGTIKTGQATANCAFNSDESMLYVTADMYLMRIGLNK
ncbi:SMP-30/gluconolactonase/LRE family protein [Bacteroidota bacterium]